jgi:AAA domain-containing protein
MEQGSKPRSVKIGDDERLGWSSERPRREGAPQRPADISTRNRVLKPSEELLYSPGSLVVVASSAPDQAEGFVTRLVQSKGALFSLNKVRALLQGRVGEAELEARAQELLTGAIAKRLESGETVVVVMESLDAEEREPFVRLAAAAGRPRHLILFEPAGVDLDDERKAALSDLRRRLTATELGQEGFQTSLRLAGSTIGEVKRLDFQRPSRDD